MNRLIWSAKIWETDSTCNIKLNSSRQSNYYEEGFS